MAFDLDDDELKATLEMNNYKGAQTNMILPHKKETTTSNVELGTAYDINKNLVKKYEHELIKDEIDEKFEMMKQYVNEKSNHYYMLLCNDKKDYTIFHTTVLEDLHSIPQELLECLYNRGLVYGIDRTEDGVAIEIWLMIDNEPYCYYFFPYDEAIVEC